jgi:hypothetical protein
MRQYRRMALVKPALGMLDNCSAELRPWYQYRAGGWPRDTDSITLSEPALPNRLCSPSPPPACLHPAPAPRFSRRLSQHQTTTHQRPPTLSPLMCRTGACCSQRSPPARVPPAPGGLFVTSPLPLTSSEQEQGLLATPELRAVSATEASFDPSLLLPLSLSYPTNHWPSW